MTEPERAVEHARRAAEQARRRGGYAEKPPSFEIQAPSRISDWRLSEWAIIEPEATRVYSTRRLGAPITWLKQGLLRLLRQYNDQIVAQQSRFNAHVAAHVMSLDDRVHALEEHLGKLELAQQSPTRAGAQDHDQARNS